LVDIATDIGQVVGVSNDVIVEAALPYGASEGRIELGYGSGGKTLKGADDFGEAVLVRSIWLPAIRPNRERFSLVQIVTK
jgi:hypothetical protein